MHVALAGTVYGCGIMCIGCISNVWLVQVVHTELDLADATCGRLVMEPCGHMARVKDIHTHIPGPHLYILR